MQVSSSILTLRALTHRTVSILCRMRLIPSSARKLLSQRNSQKAKADRESVFKASQSAGKNANVQREKKKKNSWCRADKLSPRYLTYSRVPRMTSSIDPVRLELGTSGRRVRGGGFLRRADWGGRDSEEELCSRDRRGHGLLEGIVLEPDLWPCCSSVSLYEKRSLYWCRSKRLNAAKQGVYPRNRNVFS